MMIYVKKILLDWTAQMVLAILLMHSKNILHRDITTENMFLTKHYALKLGGFGFSKALGDQKDFGARDFISPGYKSYFFTLNLTSIYSKIKRGLQR